MQLVWRKIKQRTNSIKFPKLWECKKNIKQMKVTLITEGETVLFRKNFNTVYYNTKNINSLELWSSYRFEEFSMPFTTKKSGHIDFFELRPSFCLEQFDDFYYDKKSHVNFWNLHELWPSFHFEELFMLFVVKCVCLSSNVPGSDLVIDNRALLLFEWNGLPGV